MVSEVLDDPELLQIRTIQPMDTINSWCQKHWIARTIDSRISLCQNNLDLKDLMSAELFSWICGLTIISRIIVWLPCEHSETQT